MKQIDSSRLRVASNCQIPTPSTNKIILTALAKWPLPLINWSKKIRASTAR